MGLFDDMFAEDEIITEEIHGYLPEERERALRDIYGRSKEEFSWVDFGDDSEESSSDYDDEDNEDDDEDDYDDDDI